MKGIVEIYNNFGTPNQELIHRESNLLVDGAGEAICSMLTTPSGTASGVSPILDASNFTVQAISFGKSSDAYKLHGHYYPFFASAYESPTSPYHGYVNLVKTDHIVRGKSYVNENVASSFYSFDPLALPGTPPNPHDTQLEPNTHTAIDAVSGQMFQKGPQLVQGRTIQVGHNLNRLACSVNPNFCSYTRTPTDDPGWGTANAHWKYSNNVINTTETGLSSINSGPFYGTSAILLQKNVAIGGNLRQEYPNNKLYFHKNVDHTFSMYLKQPATNAVSAFELNIVEIVAEPFTTKGHKALFVWSGTAERSAPEVLSVSGANGAVPFITKVEGITPGWYRVGVMLSGVGTGGATSGIIRSNLVILGTGTTDAQIFTYGWQMEERYGASPFHEVSGSYPSFEERGLPGNIFLGCYPEASGTKFAIVSGIENQGISPPYAAQDVQVSGVYPHHPDVDYFFNSSSIRSMDQNGFVRSYNANLGQISNPTSGLIVSSFHGRDASCQGEVVYVCTISSGDLGLANMYGGIFKMGLWTIDIEKTMSGKNPYGYLYSNDLSGVAPVAQPPFTFCAGFNRLVYKLFAEKSFTKNLAKIKDENATANAKKGCFQYDPLTIVWRIKFI